MAQPIIEITDGAAEQIKVLLDKRDKPSLGIRVGVKQGGCSGLEYTFEYADDTEPGEEVISDKGVTVYIKPLAVMYLLGTVLEYHEDKMESGFKFNNPNVKGSCGCGKSFTV